MRRATIDLRTITTDYGENKSRIMQDVVREINHLNARVRQNGKEGSTRWFKRFLDSLMEVIVKGGPCVD